MSSMEHRGAEVCQNHNFKDYCNTSEHSQAFVASHLNAPVKGAELHKESYSKEKIKTINVALVVCLNMDIDPPDVQKIPPYSRVEAWVDPADAGFRVVEMIGKNLQSQYERWQPKGYYRQCLDPNLEEVKKICMNMRRNARTDRILFHYNGHGVPRPTENGEIWVFNRTFTKYIPLSLYDLQKWLGGPSVYVIECQNAGRVLKLYKYFCQRRQADTANPPGDGSSSAGGPNPDAGQLEPGAFGHAYPSHTTGLSQISASTVAPATMENTIMLCACEENEDLPQLAELPADLFTSCLTTPIKTALRWHWMKYNKYFPGRIDEAMLDNIPGNHGNRMSLLGEINWIFTAVTDTIAWCSFPVELFQKLFRQDLLVASIFRNYLLAERLMRAFGCHPCSWPGLAPTHDHPIWGAWDHALDLLFHYLPQVLMGTEGVVTADALLYQYRQQQLNLLNELPLVLAPQPASDVPPELFELTAAKTQELLAKLAAVDQQVASSKERKMKKTSGRDITPPPGYEKVDSTVASISRGRHTHGRTGGSPRRSTRFLVQKHDPTQETTEPGQDTASMTTTSSTTTTSANAPTQPHSAPSNLPRGSHLHGHHHHHHQQQHQQRDNEGEPEETESYASSSDIDVDEDDLEDEEDDDVDDEDESEEEEEYDDSHRSQESPVETHHQKSQNSQRQEVQEEQANQRLIRKASMPDMPKNLGLLSTLSIRSDPNASDSSNRSSSRPRPVIGAASVLARINQYRPAPIIGPTPLPLVKTPPVDSRPCTFFTSQMTAFALWLRTCSNDSSPASRERQAAVQLPILLQVLLSQTHRLRALQLLSEFLDLGPWAVAHCITVGILPYIVRLFHSNVLDVKPQLVFIWGKIIASAQIDFSRHEGIRESGYRYFVSCLQDAANLSPLVRTMAAFALAKMLVKGDTGEPDPLFQEVYYTSKPLSFIQIAAEEINRATTSTVTEATRAGHAYDHLKVWLLLALGRVWMNSDEAKWLVLRPEGRRVVDSVIFPLLSDPDPVVRASAVFALGTLIDHIGGLAERRLNSADADMISHQVGVHLQQCTRDPSLLVRCEVVVALRALVEQYEPNMVEQAYTYYCAIIRRLPLVPPIHEPAASISPPVEHSRTVSQAAAAILLRGMTELGRISRSRSHRDLRHNSTTSVSQPSSASALIKNTFTVEIVDPPGDHIDSIPMFVEDFAPNTPTNIFAQLWDMVLVLAADPHPNVSKLANIIMNHILEELIETYDVTSEVVVVNGRLYLREASLSASEVATAGDGGNSTEDRSQTPMASFQQQQQPSMVMPPRITRRRYFAGADASAIADGQRPIEVKTEFFQWCSRWFSQPLLHKYPESLQISQKCTAQYLSPTGILPEPSTTIANSLDPPHLSPALNPNDLYSLAGICSDPRAKTFADYLRNFNRHDALRVQGRQRWHAIARQQKLAPSAQYNSLAEVEESRRNLRYIVHRAARTPSPLSPTRRNCRHGTRFKDMGVRYCSNDVFPHLRIHDEHHVEHGVEATEFDPKVGTHELQVVHIFQPSKTSPARGFASTAKFHPYKPHLVTAEALGSLEEYAVTIWGVHRADKVRRLTLAETMTRIPMDSIITVSAALGEEIKKQRALQERYNLAQVTSLEVLNALEERSLLLTASRDGCVRVWQNYDGKSGAIPSLLTSWVALETQVPLSSSQRTAGVGLVTSWSDCSLHHLLYVSGDVRFVRVFDTDCEAQIADFKTLATCPVTRLARASVAEGDTGGDYIFAAGFADGRVKVFDARLPSHNAVIFEASCGGTGPVLDLAFAPFQADRRFYAVTSSGAVGAWQLEAPSPNFNSSSWLPIAAQSSDCYQNSNGVIRSAHLQVELPCTRSHMVIYTSGRGLNVARLDDGQLIASYQPESKAHPTAVAMHPYEPLIALAMNDTSIHLLKFRISA